MVIAPELGADAVAGYINTKAGIAQKMILSMVATGLAIRTGRVYSNLRVDLEASNTKWVERQIAIVMEAGDAPAPLRKRRWKAVTTTVKQRC
jgi:N-acetylmuramic acid 6-phosphate etherase